MSAEESSYSRIQGIYLTNFMSIKSGTVEFSPDSNIIQIVGYNDSGKSVILRALNVVFNNAYATKQKSFIHNDARYFQIDVTFDDGVLIRYEKHASGSSLYEMYANGEELVYTNKLRDGIYEKITDVPSIIKDYLGMVSVGATDQILNYGTNTDKQLLVETSGSENYQALSSALKSEELSRAVKLANRDNNDLKGQINVRHTEFMGYSMQYNELKGIDSLLVDTASEFASLVSNGEALVQGIDSALTEADAAKSIADLPDLEAVDLGPISVVDSALGHYDAVVSLEDTPDIDHVDVASLHRVSSVLAEADSLLRSSDGFPDELDALPLAEDAHTLSTLDATLRGISDIKDIQSRIAEEKDTLSDLRLKSDKMASDLKAEGRIISICDNCGELNLVDIS